MKFRRRRHQAAITPEALSLAPENIEHSLSRQCFAGTHPSAEARRAVPGQRPALFPRFARDRRCVAGHRPVDKNTLASTRMIARISLVVGLFRREVDNILRLIRQARLRMVSDWRHVSDCSARSTYLRQTARYPIRNRGAILRLRCHSLPPANIGDKIYSARCCRRWRVIFHGRHCIPELPNGENLQAHCPRPEAA